MQACAATPVRRPAEPSSPTPSPSSLRQWRPAAQRNLRNQWSRLGWRPPPPDAPTPPRSSTPTSPSVTCLGWIWGCSRTCRGSATGRAPSWCTRRCNATRCFYQAYKEMVLAVSDLVKASRAMRCLSKASSGSSLVRFADSQDDLNDSGDGGGAPVFKLISMSEFEDLAQELVEMFVSELQLKRLIVLELLSINLEGADLSLEWSGDLYDGELYEFLSTGLRSRDRCPLPGNWRADVWQARLPGHTPSHEVLQIYLTSWLANVNIKMSRIDEILELVGEEMQIRLC